MDEEEKDLILKETEELLKNCNETLKEIEESKRCVDFLINEYRTNKRYFREEPGKVTIEDVIKTCFEFGWGAKGNFDYAKDKRKKPK